MTNEEMIQDFKQFIEVTVSQQLTGVATKDDIDTAINGLRDEIKADIKDLKGDVGSLKADVARLDEKIDAVQDAIAETVTHVADGAEAAVREHEERYHGRLKHRAA